MKIDMKITLMMRRKMPLEVAKTMMIEGMIRCSNGIWLNWKVEEERGLG
jgi:hypothetical protein